jgi:integrase
MFVFAAHTGARRSEIVRALPSDVDLAGGMVTIREKKRDKTKFTTRRVPLTPFLKEVLADWMKKRGKGKTLFCKSDGKGITPREAHNSGVEVECAERLACLPTLVHLRPGQQGRGPANHR